MAQAIPLRPEIVHVQRAILRNAQRLRRTDLDRNRCVVCQCPLGAQRRANPRYRPNHQSLFAQRSLRLNVGPHALFELWIARAPQPVAGSDTRKINRAVGK